MSNLFTEKCEMKHFLYGMSAAYMKTFVQDDVFSHDVKGLFFYIMCFLPFI